MGKEIVVVIDGGGRGSALVDKYLQSPHVGKVLAIPGNDWMKTISHKSVELFPQIPTTDIANILKICQEEKPSLVDVAQDNAIEAGVTDSLLEAGFKVMGPTKKAGQIEWDKAWARKFGKKWDLPQPRFKVCETEQEGINYLNPQKDHSWFIKAAFLAEGKGVIRARDNREAREKINQLRAKFPQAARRFLIETCLSNDDGTAGEEFSTFILCDGENYQVIGSAQDHKTVNDFDEGENTGGMGCSTPPLVLTPEIQDQIDQQIIKKAVVGLQAEGRPYQGILYLGGSLIYKRGKLEPSVIEFNSRWGDPEAQVILPGLKNDLFEIGMAVADGNIKNLKVEMDGKSRVVVAGVARGYPGDYSQVKEKEIFGLLETELLEEKAKVFGAGLKIEGGRYFVSGGRAFYILGEGSDIIEARRSAYGAMSGIFIEGNNLHFRTDIGWRDLARLSQHSH